MSTELIALYEIRRQAFLIGFIQSPRQFNSALAYAYENRIFPSFHMGEEREVYGFDPYDKVYCVSGKFVSELLAYLDEKWRAEQLDDVGFYRLETKYGKDNRVALVQVLTYCRITGRFDDKLWAAVESNAPTEATRIAKEFLPTEVYFG